MRHHSTFGRAFIGFAVFAYGLVVGYTGNWRLDSARVAVCCIAAFGPAVVVAFLYDAIREGLAGLRPRARVYRQRW